NVNKKRGLVVVDRGRGVRYAVAHDLRETLVLRNVLRPRVFFLKHVRIGITEVCLLLTRDADFFGSHALKKGKRKGKQYGCGFTREHVILLCLKVARSFTGALVQRRARALVEGEPHQDGNAGLSHFLSCSHAVTLGKIRPKCLEG